jgi:hypothetical protein
MPKLIPFQIAQGILFGVLGAGLPPVMIGVTAKIVTGFPKYPR